MRKNHISTLGGTSIFKTFHLLKTSTKRALLLAILFTISLIAHAQAGELDFTFTPRIKGFTDGEGPSSPVNTIAIQQDGKILIGGEFGYYNRVARMGIARINIDGTLDFTFIPEKNIIDPINKPSYDVTSIALQNDGKIIVSINNKIYRLNSDGSKDYTFNSESIILGSIRTIALQSDGKIIAGGFFDKCNGIKKYGIARFNNDGTLDNTFNPDTIGVRVDVNRYIEAIAIQNDGKIIVGNNSSESERGYKRSNTFRLNSDGTFDDTFNAPINLYGYVNSINILNDGKIFIAGNFGDYSNLYSRKIGCIARLNNDGTLDYTFKAKPFDSSHITSSALQNDGKIIIGGILTDYECNFIRLNSDGTIDNSFKESAIYSKPPSSPEAIAIQSNGKIITGINYELIRLNSNGSKDIYFNPKREESGNVKVTAMQSDGKIIIGGDFVTCDELERYGIARLINGSLDRSFEPKLGMAINSIEIQSDGKIIVVGESKNDNGTPTVRMVRLNSNGTLDTTFNSGLGVGLYSSINDVAIQSNGKIIIGGRFSNYNGIPMSNLARLNIDGTLDTTFNSGDISKTKVTSITIQSDGKIIIGGYNSTSYNNYLIRLHEDGTIDNSFYVRGKISNEIKSVALQKDGKIIVAGNFYFYNENSLYPASTDGIIRLNSDGSLDDTFNSNSGKYYMIETVAIQNDGKIIFGGGNSWSKRRCYDPPQ